MVIRYNDRMKVDRIARQQINVQSSKEINVVEFDTLPFVPRRIYWLHESSLDISRGNHAHRELRQILFVLNGRFRLRLSDGFSDLELYLDKKSDGVYLEPGLWRVLDEFAKDSIILVICDQVFQESDYIRNYEEFLDWSSKQRLS